MKLLFRLLLVCFGTSVVFGQLNKDYFTQLKFKKVRSSDRIEWKQFGPGMAGYCEEYWIHPTDDNTMFMGPDMHIAYRSFNEGKSWETLKDYDGLGYHMERVIDMDFSRQDKNFGMSIDRDGGLFITNDKGKNWEFKLDLGKHHSEIAVDPTNDHVWFIGAGGFWNVKDNHRSLEHPHGKILKNANYGYIWKTSNKGKSWKRVKQGLPENVDVGQILINPKNPSHIIACTGHGMFKSTNGGESWFVSAKGLPNNLPRALTDYYNSKTQEYILYAVEHTVYKPNGKSIVSQGGIFKSTDGGDTWESITGNLAINLKSLDYHLAKQKYYRAIAYWLGMDKKKAKKKYPEIPTTALTVFNRIVVNPNNPKEIYISQNNKHDFAFPPGDIWKTTDGGKSWAACARVGRYWDGKKNSEYWKSRGNQLGMNVQFAHIHRERKHLEEYQGVRFLEINSKGEVYTCIDQQVLKTANGGLSWEQQDDRETTLNSKTWIGKGGSDMPGRYILLETGIKGRKLFCSGEHGLWQSVPTKDPIDKEAVAVQQIEGQVYHKGAHSIASVAVHPKDPNIIYTLQFRQNHRGYFRRSLDAGKTWENISKPIQYHEKNMSIDKIFQYSLLVDPDQPKNIYFCAIKKAIAEVNAGQTPKDFKDYGVYKSTDGGYHWKLANNGFDEGASIRRIVMHPKKSSVLYAASNAIGKKNKGGLYISKNKGKRWEKIKIPSVINSVNNIFIDKTTEALYISCGTSYSKIQEGGVWKSIDNGKKWIKIFDMPYIWQTETSPLNPNIIIVSAPSQAKHKKNGTLNPGVYISTDGGKNWIKANKNLAQQNKIVEVKPDIEDEHVFWCAGWGSGWYKGVLKE